MSKLDEEISRYLRDECSADNEPTISEIAKYFAEWQWEQMKDEHGKALLYVCQKTAEREYRNGVREGKAQVKKELGWHSVNESLPPIDEEVIVLTDDIHGKIVPDSHYICYGHIVDKNIAVDYDGWNIPGVTHWMYLPKLEEE